MAGGLAASLGFLKESFTGPNMPPRMPPRKPSLRVTCNA